VFGCSRTSRYLCSGWCFGLRSSGERLVGRFSFLSVRAGDEVEPEFLTDAEIRRRESESLFAVLQKTGWKIKGVDGAAELLGLKPTTLNLADRKDGFEATGLKEPVDDQCPKTDDVRIESATDKGRV
jgi:hypothetical protein